MKTSRGASGRRLPAVLGAILPLAVLITPTAGWAATAADLFLERSVMAAANARCRLFAPDVASALAASKAQARGAALRAGADPQVLAQMEQRAAQRAGSVTCASPDMRTVAARVRSAFDGYAKLYRITYPGDVAAWKAERTSPAAGAGWRLSQASRFGPDQAVFGLAGRRGQAAQLAVSALFIDGAAPYAARLVVRDPMRSARPTLGGARGGPTGRLPLSSRLAPRSATRQFLAAERGTDAQLSPSPGRPAVVFRFPPAALAALGQLDPREAVSVEFLFPSAGRDRPRTALFEVGDFTAGQAFLAAAR